MYGRHISVKLTDFYGSIKSSYEHYGSKAHQIVMKSPQRKQLSPLTKDDAERCKAYVEEHGIYIIAHSGYLFNIASDPATNGYAIETAVDDLITVSDLGGRGAVFHVGKHKKMGEEAGVNNMYFNVHAILMESVGLAPDSIFILETAAGQGTECCLKLEQLAAFRDMFDEEEKRRIRFCLDTCHIFVAGTLQMKNNADVDDFFNKFEELIGLKHLRLIHFNDSKKEVKSHVDRHENIGKGKIDLMGLKTFANIAHKYQIPMVLETPGLGYQTEIKMVKKMIAS